MHFSFLDPTLQVLIALSLRCDVFSGIKELDPKTIQEKIHELVSNEKQGIPGFRDLMKSKNKTMDNVIINSLVSVNLCKPGLIDTTKKVSNSYDNSINNDEYVL